MARRLEHFSQEVRHPAKDVLGRCHVAYIRRKSIWTSTCRRMLRVDDFDLFVEDKGIYWFIQLESQFIGNQCSVYGVVG